ncbi:MAG: hypothetical protein OXI34_01370 [Chloroflexota bacterium]|nr:hypothetical protein [Chloroflexota bacterium]MDE2856178.1 hypothetical protein [Chloroflexota bacterium]MDE2947415.1 hypothetical protein [Chloroflexota bacterium]
MPKRFFGLIAASVLLGVMTSSTSIACQGPSPYDFANISEMDLWARATVMDVDDRGFSAILKVREYFKGEGPEWLAVIRYPVGLQTAHRVRGYPTAPCLYAGHGTRLIHGRAGYYGLSSNGDGTFTDLLYNAAHYFFVDGEMDGEYYVDDPDGFMDEIVLSEAEFVERLLAVGGRENAVEPIQSAESRPLLMRYLLVTLEDGTLLHVNPDRSLSFLGEDDPIAISPDGAHTVYRAGDDTLVFNYIWGKRFMEESFRDQIKKPGQNAAFSPDSNMVAVWDDDHVAVYIYRQHGVPYELGRLARTALERNASTDSQNQVRGDLMIKWSADSGTIAWQENSGIWRWNLYEEAAPELVPGTPERAALNLIGLSRSGRFVSYHSGAELRLFDSQLQKTFHNAVVAPNENTVIKFEPDRERLRQWKRETSCRAPMNENCAELHTYSDGSFISSFPYQMELMGSVFCGEYHGCRVLGQPWHPSRNFDTGYIGGREINVSMRQARQIAYDPFYDKPAVLRGDYQIEFDFYFSGYFEGWLDIDESDFARLDYLNLEGIVDSPIASIEWGQPIFYDRFMLTATEYLPRTVTIAGGA